MRIFVLALSIVVYGCSKQIEEVPNARSSSPTLESLIIEGMAARMAKGEVIDTSANLLRYRELRHILPIHVWKAMNGWVTFSVGDGPNKAKTVTVWNYLRLSCNWAVLIFDDATWGIVPVEPTP